MQTLPLNRMAVLLAVVLALPACSSLGPLGDILGSMGGIPGGSQQSGQITAEVQQVDSRQQQIYVRTQDGRTGAVFYDRNTAVVYRQQQYPVTALERGDVVTMRVQQDSRNNLYTDYIVVEQSVQERTGQSPGGIGGQMQRLEGRIGRIDYERGMFELQGQFSGVVIVGLPYNPPRALADRFRRLRSGDYVRIEGQYLSQDRVELYRFL